MAVKVGTFSRATAAAPASQSITGVGFAPVAILFWAGGGAVSGTYATGVAAFVGMTAGPTNSASATVAMQDAVSPTSTRQRMDTAPVCVLGPTSVVPIARATLASFDADGFTLAWTATDPAGGLVHYLAIGGAGAAAKVVPWLLPTVAGNKSVAGAGFAPTGVLHVATLVFGATPPEGKTGASLSIGAQDGGGGQWALGVAAESGGAASASGRFHRSDSCLGVTAASTLVTRATHVSLDADGFTVNFPAAPAVAYNVATLCLGGIPVDVGGFAKTSAAAPATQSVAGVGFRPAAVVLAGNQELTYPTTTSHARLAFGAADAAGQAAVAIQYASSVNPSSADAIGFANRLYARINNDTPVLDARATLASLDADGFAATWSPNDTAQNSIAYLALGPTAANHPLTASMIGSATIAVARLRLAHPLGATALGAAAFAATGFGPVHKLQSTMVGTATLAVAGMRQAQPLAVEIGGLATFAATPPLDVPPEIDPLPDELPATTNLVANPSVEIDLFGIETQGAIRDRDTTWAWDGIASVKIMPAGVGPFEGLVWPSVSDLLLTGRARTFSASIALGTPGVAVTLDAVALRVEYTDGGRAQTPNQTVTLGAKPTLVEFAGLTVDAARTVDRLAVVALNTTPQALPFWADGCQIEQRELPTPLAMGSFAGGDHTWLGAAHRSPSTRRIRAYLRVPPGRGGWGRLSARLELRTLGNEFVRDVSDYVVKGSVDFDVDRQIKTTFTCEVRDTAPFRPLAGNGYLAPFLRLDYADGTSVESQMGLFCLPPYETELTPRWERGTLQAHDVTWLLAQQALGASTTVRMAQRVTTVLAQILGGSGVRWVIPVLERTARLDRTFRRDESKLATANALCETTGLYDLWADKRGVVTTVPFFDLDANQAAVRYRGRIGHPSERILGTIKRLPNPRKVVDSVVVVSDPPGRDAIRSRLRITNPNHPLRERTGNRDVVEVWRSGHLASQEVADQLARRLLRRRAADFTSLEFDTLPDPRRRPHEVYELSGVEDERGRPVANGFWYCTGWRIGFDQNGGRMTHRASKLDTWEA